MSPEHHQSPSFCWVAHDVFNVYCSVGCIVVARRITAPTRSGMHMRQVACCVQPSPGSSRPPDAMAAARQTKAAIRRGDASAVFRGSPKEEAELVSNTTQDVASKLNNIVMRLDPENRGGRTCWSLCVSSSTINDHRTLLMCTSTDLEVCVCLTHAGECGSPQCCSHSLIRSHT